MHILLVADGRSPTTLNYLKSLYALGVDVSLISTFPCQQPDGLRGFEVVPVALGRFAGSQVTPHSSLPITHSSAGLISPIRKITARLRKFGSPLRYFAGPFSLPRYQKRFLQMLKRLQPDLVHALRIPYEGMLAACTPIEIPLIVSIWGNDLTLHAHGSPLMTAATRKTLQRADGLIADTRRDIRLGHEWGFDAAKPVLVIPGSGGLDLQEIERASQATTNLPPGIPETDSLVVNPRGFRPGSVRNDTFFAAIPLVLQHLPKTIFACCAMQGQPEALDWVERLNIRDNVVLLPYLPREQVWALFRAAKVTVSISQHDGTPNSLLEAMACGCFPIAGDIESLREWIRPGQNGLLVDPSNPQELAQAIVRALSDQNLRSSAARINDQIVQTQAEIKMIQAKQAEFYRYFAERDHPPRGF